MKYDIPSILKIGGYSIHPRYNEQPKTCHLCNSRDHIVDNCPNNTRSALRNPDSQKQQNKAPMSRVEQIAKAVEESINNIKDQPGISVNSPQFKDMIQKQLKRFEEKEVKRQKERLEERQRQHLKS